MQITINSRGEAARSFAPNHQPRSIGEAIAIHEAFRSLPRNGRQIQASATFDGYPNFDSFRSALLSSGITGYTGQVTAPVVKVGIDRPTLRSLFSDGTTNLGKIPYLREVSFTATADTVAEGAAKPEQEFDTEQEEAEVKKIAAWTKMSDELLGDSPAVADFVNARLVDAVHASENYQILNGDGEGRNILGVLNVPGIQTQAVASDTKLDAIHKAITKVHTGSHMQADAAVLHPTDWETLTLLKDAEDKYYGKGPHTEGGQHYIWGLPVVLTTGIAQGTALVGAFKPGGQIFQRMGISVDMTNSNEDDFKKNLVAIRAEERLTLCIYRPLAFCEITGL